MPFRKVSAKEEHYLLIKNKYEETYKEFGNYVDILIDRRGRRTKKSGTASSYARYLFFMAVLYEEYFKQEIGDLNTLDGMYAIERLVNLQGFSQYNMDEGRFPNATINYYRNYMQSKGIEIDELYEILKEEVLMMTAENVVEQIFDYIRFKGFNYSIQNITNLYLSLRTKPFVIISGISGTGKTKIVQLFAESIGATEDNGQFMLVPVRPDWSDSSELLGYTDIKGDFIEGQLTKLIRHAIDEPNRPHFLLLDEMNLARVEYYFSDILSVMESRKIVGNKVKSSPLVLSNDESLYLPDNLYIIGTVNMDETTHPFSKKVLDRANTIEFNEIDLNSFSFLQKTEEVEPIFLANSSLAASYLQLQQIYEEHQLLVEKVSKDLATINETLKEIHAQVGYRVRDEICFYMVHNEEGQLLTENEAFDFCLMQKILPRISGSGLRVEGVINNMKQFAEDQNLQLSLDKLQEMQRRLEEDEFTSFWIS